MGSWDGHQCVWMPQPVLSEILPPALPILELLTQQERLLSESWLAPATSHLSNPSFLHLSHGDKRACWKVPIKSPQHRPGARLSSHLSPATSSVITSRPPGHVRLGLCTALPRPPKRMSFPAVRRGWDDSLPHTMKRSSPKHAHHVPPAPSLAFLLW